MRTVKRGDAIPYGLSKWEDILDRGWQLLVPAIAWHGQHYDITRDAYRPVWAAFSILLKRRRQEISVRWGWSFIKQTGGDQCRS